MESTEYIPEPTDGRVRVNRKLKTQAEELGLSPARICDLALKEATTDGRVRVNRKLKMQAEELGLSPARICDLALKEAIRKMKQEEVPASSVMER